MQHKLEIPEPLRSVLASGIIRSVEYGEQYVIIEVDARKFFTRALEGTGIEAVVSENCKVVFRIPTQLE